jgi:hypothetical protein
MRNGLSKQDELASDIGKGIQKALRLLLDPLLEAIRDLKHSMKKQSLPLQLSQSEMDRMFDQVRDRLDGDRPVSMTANPLRQGKARSGWKIPGLKRGLGDKAGAE